MGPWTKIAALFVLSAPLGVFASACVGAEPSTEEDPAADTVTAADEVSGEASSAEELSRIRGSRCEIRCRDDFNKCMRRGGRPDRRRELRCRNDFNKCTRPCRRR